MHRIGPPPPVSDTIEPKQAGKPALREQQQRAISYAFYSSLLSNPRVTLDIVRRAAEA